jgi:hypothetical protein
MILATLHLLWALPGNLQNEWQNNNGSKRVPAAGDSILMLWRHFTSFLIFGQVKGRKGLGKGGAKSS